MSNSCSPSYNRAGKILTKNNFKFEFSLPFQSQQRHVKISLETCLNI